MKDIANKKQEWSLKWGWWREEEKQWWNFQREDKKKKKPNKKKRRFWRRGFWGNKGDKASNIAGKWPCSPPSKRQSKTQKQKPKPNKKPKKEVWKHLRMWRHNPPFLIDFLFSVTYIVFSATIVFAKNTVQSVFSAEHRFCRQIVKALLETPSKNTLFQKNGFPLCPLTPLFL